METTLEFINRTSKESSLFIERALIEYATTIVSNPSAIAWQGLPLPRAEFERLAAEVLAHREAQYEKQFGIPSRINLIPAATGELDPEDVTTLQVDGSLLPTAADFVQWEESNPEKPE